MEVNTVRNFRFKRYRTVLVPYAVAVTTAGVTCQFLTARAGPRLGRDCGGTVPARPPGSDCGTVPAVQCQAVPKFRARLCSARGRARGRRRLRAAVTLPPLGTTY